VVTHTVALPEITSVRFENGQTIITGTVTPVGTRYYFTRIGVYANDAPDPSGYGEGQYVLGEVNGEGDEGGPYRFTFVWPGDLRGKWVTATTTRFEPSREFVSGLFTTTSEFSRAVEVK
jgi:hypothetical protein